MQCKGLSLKPTSSAKTNVTLCDLFPKCFCGLLGAFFLLHEWQFGCSCTMDILLKLEYGQIQYPNHRSWGRFFWKNRNNVWYKQHYNEVLQFCSTEMTWSTNLILCRKIVWYRPQQMSHSHVMSSVKEMQNWSFPLIMNYIAFAISIQVFSHFC